MALLKLKDIGKIYVSQGNVAVGIRGVNLSFERGEFVAVTGKSGSGKSTLLNVISGMDSYEEGEMEIEGQVTSHYLQQDWESYREKYISFIFQDYNIIESYTVLENVELALMHIENKKERRARAMELLRRVGMEKFIRHKGSKLSGGQKQRTVIARALAKDSPIILADEPTGNLDSATSAEIIELLHEVSRDKLLIMVTHNFEQVEHIASRHIRIFDGAVESDHMIEPPTPSEKTAVSPSDFDLNEKKDIKREINNGITLGIAIFKAKPRLSFFMCMLLIIGTLVTFVITASSSDIKMLFEKSYMFTPIDGRMVIVRRDGQVMTNEEIEALVKETGAESYLRFDNLLDPKYTQSYYYASERIDVSYKCTYGKDYGEPDIGRYPQKEGEILLYAPISYQTVFGKKALKQDYIEYEGVPLKVVGVKYYYDNNKTAEALFTLDGFRALNTTATMNYGGNDLTLNLSVDDGSGNILVYGFGLYETIVTSEIEDGKICIIDTDKVLGKLYGSEDLKIDVSFSGKYNYFSATGSQMTSTFEYILPENCLTENAEQIPQEVFENHPYSYIAINSVLYRDVVEEFLSKTYRQASIFYKNDKACYAAVDTLKEKGYIAVPSDTVREPDVMDIIENTISAAVAGIIWFATIVFIAFFINLCTSRAIEAFKSDMAIMRSMGIHVTVIKIGMYFRMVISLIPAFIFVILTGIGIFTSPKINGFFSYMYAWQYALIFLGMLIMVFRITHKQIHRLFNESVKKSLKGGGAQ